jgi:hypothetical protein
MRKKIRNDELFAIFLARFKNMIESGEGEASLLS